jgi:hypothetical protein
MIDYDIFGTRDSLIIYFNNGFCNILWNPEYCILHFSTVVIELFSPFPSSSYQLKGISI